MSCWQLPKALDYFPFSDIPQNFVNWKVEDEPSFSLYVVEVVLIYNGEVKINFYWKIWTLKKEKKVLLTVYSEKV